MSATNSSQQEQESRKNTTVAFDEEQLDGIKTEAGKKTESYWKTRHKDLEAEHHDLQMEYEMLQSKYSKEVSKTPRTPRIRKHLPDQLATEDGKLEEDVTLSVWNDEDFSEV